MKLHRKILAPPRIEMLPLIDIVFLLLVFFIYAMLSMAVHHGQSVDLPNSGSASLEVHDAISITIQTTNQKNMAIFLNEEPVSLELLEKKLQQKQVKKESVQECEVQIFADKLVPYQRLFQVLDRIKQAGITRISLQAEPEARVP